jgi:hypothetical protein
VARVVMTSVRLRASIEFSNAVTATAALDLVGLGLHADRKIIDKIVGSLKFLS